MHVLSNGVLDFFSYNCTIFMIKFSAANLVTLYMACLANRMAIEEKRSVGKKIDEINQLQTKTCN